MKPPYDQHREQLDDIGHMLVDLFLVDDALRNALERKGLMRRAVEGARRRRAKKEKKR